MDYFTYMYPVDRERIATALDFYVNRVAWSSGDAIERAEFERLSAEAKDYAGRKEG